MRSAKEILLMVRDFRYRIRTCRLSVEALFQDAYGLDLHIDYEGKSSSTHDPKSGETVLVSKLDALDGKVLRVQREIEHYLELIYWLEDLCETTLDDAELLVIRMSFFGKEVLNRDQVARSLHYSSAWVAKTRTSAYKKLDDRLFELRRDHQLPEEFDDEHI